MGFGYITVISSFPSCVKPIVHGLKITGAKIVIISI